MRFNNHEGYGADWELWSTKHESGSNCDNCENLEDLWCIHASVNGEYGFSLCGKCLHTFLSEEL